MNVATRGFGKRSGMLSSMGYGRRVIVFIEILGQYISARSRVWAMTADSRSWTDMAVDRIWAVMSSTRAWSSTKATRAWLHFANRSWSVSKLRAWLADADRSWNRSKHGD